MPRWFWLLIALHLIPIWGVDYFLTQDGPIHIANAWTFFQYDAETAGLFREYYVRNPSAAPNWLIQVLLAGLMSVFRPETAEKILASAFVVLLPASLVYVSESVRKGSGAIAVLAFPMIFTWFLNTGLYNFCFGVSICFFVTGYWLRTRDEYSLTHTLLMTAGFVLLYFAHIFAFMATAVTLGLIALIDWKPDWRALMTNAVAAIPALALTGVFVAGKQARVGVPTENVNILIDRASDMLFLEPFISYHDHEGWAFGALALMLFAGFVWAAVQANRSRSRATLAVLCIPATFVLLYLFMPMWALQGSFIPERSLYIAALSVVPVLAACRLNAAQEKVLGGIAVAIALVLVVFQTGTMMGLNDQLKDVMSCGDDIERDTTLVPINRLSGSRIDPLEHATSYWVVEHGIVSLANFSAYRGNHPMLYRESLAPLPSIGCLGCDPPTLDVKQYLLDSQGRVDYVLIRGGREAEPVEEGYASVCVATEHGRVELFRSNSLN